jgi:hypothetical protein
MDFGAIITIALALLGFVGWLWQMHGRLGREEAVREEQFGSLKDRLNSFEQRIYDVLERIENKIDRKADRS